MFAVCQVLSQVAREGPSIKRCLSWKSESALQGLLGASDSIFYVGLESGTLVALESKGLTVKWRAELGGKFTSDAVAFNDSVVVVNGISTENVSGPGTSTLRLISAGTGVVSWAVKLPQSERYYLEKSGLDIAVLNSNGAFSLIDLATGRVKKNSIAFGAIGTPISFTAEKAVYGTVDQRLLLVSLRTGEVLLQTTLEYMPTSVAFSQSGNIAVGDKRGNLMLLSGDDGKVLWRFKSGAAVSSIRGNDDGVFLTSLDNFVYRLSNYNGDVIWKRRLTGRVVDDGILLDGYFAIPVFGENTVFLLDVQKGKIEKEIVADGYELLSRQSLSSSNGFLALSGHDLIETYSARPCMAEVKK